MTMPREFFLPAKPAVHSAEHITLEYTAETPQIRCICHKNGTE
jgi:hypothetical protein